MKLLFHICCGPCAAYPLQELRSQGVTVTGFSTTNGVFTTAACAVVLGERFGPWRLLGMGLVLLGLAVIVLPAAAGVTESSPRSR